MKTHKNSLCLFCIYALGACVIAATASPSLAVAAQTVTITNPSKPLANILHYISDTWDALTRTMTDCSSIEDVKTAPNGAPAFRSVLYLPAEQPVPDAVAELPQGCSVDVQHLPQRIASPGSFDFSRIGAHGLLYLEHPYVVPGGEFNEMYGWDSYFIILGLLRDNRRDLARGMLENFFYEIQHYGGVLNANRTYYLSRSQPPFLTSMILAVYNADAAAGTPPDAEWLERAYRYAVHDYQQWTQPPHRAGSTGLSRYYDHDDGPVPEIGSDPSDYYGGVIRYFLAHGLNAYLVRGHKADRFPAFVCVGQEARPDEVSCPPQDRVGLTADYYKGDRAMRESGFDVSFRFGPYGADTHYYAPVCLNSLLYKTEMDLADISAKLGYRPDSQAWKRRAADRRVRMVKYFWNVQRGLFFDYNTKTRQQSSYEYATTFYPLWAGWASPAQAYAVEGNLYKFEQANGLAMSLQDTGAQWDYPYGWAPVHLLVVEGLRRYGDSADANRISLKFLTTVVRTFERDHTLWEKYDVAKGSSETHVGAGYRQNMIGFGWTNGVFLELLADLPSEVRSRLVVP